jgi:hypothetical protein
MRIFFFLIVIFLYAPSSHSIYIQTVSSSNTPSLTLTELKNYDLTNAYQIFLESGDDFNSIIKSYSTNDGYWWWTCDGTHFNGSEVDSFDFSNCSSVVSRFDITNPSRLKQFQNWQATINIGPTGDTTVPFIFLIGQSSLNVDQFSTYIDDGSTASDSFDGDITDSISITGFVDTNNVGTYYINFNVTDQAGNVAQQVTRSITVNSVNSAVPVITLLGSLSITLIEGDIFFDSGATASDDDDGNITDQIFISGTVDTNTIGTYTLFYNVFDSDGNAANQVTRTILVESAPVENVSSEQLEKTIITIAITAFSIFGFTTGMTFRFDS